MIKTRFFSLSSNFNCSAVFTENNKLFRTWFSDRNSFIDYIIICFIIFIIVYNINNIIIIATVYIIVIITCYK